MNPVETAARNFKETKDNKSLEVLYSHVQYVNKCIAFKFGTPASEDIQQNATVKMITHINQFDPTRGMFNTWVTKIIYNEYLQGFKKVRRFDYDVEVSDAPYSGSAFGRQTLSPYETPDYEYYKVEDEQLTAEEIFELTKDYINQLDASSNVGRTFTVDDIKKFLWMRLIEQVQLIDCYKKFNCGSTSLKNILRRHKEYIIRYINERKGNKKLPKITRNVDRLENVPKGRKVGSKNKPKVVK